jgi:hypothetical protein
MNKKRSVKAYKMFIEKKIDTSNYSFHGYKNVKK